MSPVLKPQSKKPGGKAPTTTPSAENKSTSLLNNVPAEFGVVRGGKTLVVHDEKGRIVSITRVSPNSPYGVGIKPGPGQVVREYETENLQDALEPSRSEAAKKSRATKPRRA